MQLAAFVPILVDLSMSTVQGRGIWPGLLNHEGIEEEPTLTRKAVIIGGVYSKLKAESTFPDFLTLEITEDDPAGIIKRALWAARDSLRQNVDR